MGLQISFQLPLQGRSSLLEIHRASLGRLHQEQSQQLCGKGCDDTDLLETRKWLLKSQTIHIQLSV